MVTEDSILVALVMPVDRIPMPISPRRRGRPNTYSDRLFLKALVIMIVKHLPNVHSLGQFKAIFDCQGQVPTRGLHSPRRFVLGAVFVDQLTPLHRFESGVDLRVGLKPCLQAA